MYPHTHVWYPQQVGGLLGQCTRGYKMPFSHTHDIAHVSRDSALDVDNRRAREQRGKRDVLRVAKAAVRPSRTLRQQTLRNVRSCGCVEAGKLCVCVCVGLRFHQIRKIGQMVRFQFLELLT
jgi:hypothetical protein